MARIISVVVGFLSGGGSAGFGNASFGTVPFGQ